METWDNLQISTADELFGGVIPYPFPNINPEWSFVEVKRFAQIKVEEIKNLFPEPHDILIAGEQSFVFAFIGSAIAANFNCYVGTSDRLVKELPDNKKEVTYRFCKFRKINNDE